MEVEVEEAVPQEETRAGMDHLGRSRDSRAFLRSAAQHLAALLETTEAQLEILTGELLPPLKEGTDLQGNASDFSVSVDTTHSSRPTTAGESAPSGAALRALSSSLQTPSDASVVSYSDTSVRSSRPFASDSPHSPPPTSAPNAAPPPASPATVASSVLRDRNAGSSANFLETNLLLAREYHQVCCSLSRMLHEEIESLDLVREGVCGNRVYNAVLQVENLQMLKEETRNLALLRKALSEQSDP